jgi:hypothetical protein
VRVGLSLVVGSPRPGVTLRSTPGHVRAFADALLGRPRCASSSTRAFQLTEATPAPCVSGPWLGRSKSTAPPAGASFRQGGVALLGCGFVGGGVGSVGVCPRRALFERTRNLMGVQAADGSGWGLGCVAPLAPPSEPWFGGPARQGQTPTSGGTCGRCARPSPGKWTPGFMRLWAVPRDVDTGFHAAMGISVELLCVSVKACRAGSRSRPGRGSGRGSGVCVGCTRRSTGRSRGGRGRRRRTGGPPGRIRFRV